MSKESLRVLVVDDEESARSGLVKLLSSEGYAVDTAADGVEALGRLNERPADAVITDINMPNMDGIELITKVRERDKSLPIIVMSAVTDLSRAVNAMKQGADDYLTKPIDIDALLVILTRALERRDVRIEAENLRRQILERDSGGLTDLVGTSPAMQRVYRMARQVASSRATVLITGESGTGKGELARALHKLGTRSSKPFVELHCAALPETLLESELFGHERGSFTGADKRRIGRFEQAAGGTLFLDEIGEIPALTQVKLLRVLQERTFERIGSNEPISVDVRLVAATNRDLAADVASGRFREDLYYRLNVVHIEMPPLRLRGSDIVALAEHFLRKFTLENHKRIDGLTSRAREKLMAHRWPGNVRELENTIERAIVLCAGDVIDADDLPFEAGPDSFGSVRIPGSTMAELERHAILKTLESCQGSTTRAAELLGISVRTIQYRLNEYGLGKNSHAPPAPSGQDTGADGSGSAGGSNDGRPSSVRPRRLRRAPSHAPIAPAEQNPQDEAAQQESF